MFEYRRHITRQMLRDERDKLFVFGDNLLRTGYGGQAAAMRGESNAVGIPTKRKPTMEEDAFFGMHDLRTFIVASWGDWSELFRATNVVWPADGIGTGRAQLQSRAPHIWQFIEQMRVTLERVHHYDNGQA